MREDRFQGAAQPDVEEVGEVGITNVVIVWWVGGDYFVLTGRLSLRIALLYDLNENYPI